MKEQAIRSDRESAQEALGSLATPLQELQNRIRHLEAELKEAKEVQLTQEQQLTFQRRKIAQLLTQSERIGAEREALRSFERRLEHISSNPHAALAELLAWRQLGLSKLGPNPVEAEAAIECLVHYKQITQAPGHRFVAALSRLAEGSLLGRKLRGLFRFLYTILKS